MKLSRAPLSALAALLALLVLAYPRPTAAAEEGADDELTREVLAQDAALFGAYNECDLETMESYFAEDVEFYHDQTGLMRGRESVVEATKKNICGKTRRQAAPESFEVYPLHGYGAIHIGVHHFCPLEREACEPDSGAGQGRFFHVWHRGEDGRWRLTRVFSYDHRPW